MYWIKLEDEVTLSIIKSTKIKRSKKWEISMSCKMLLEMKNMNSMKITIFKLRVSKKKKSKKKMSGRMKRENSTVMSKILK